MATIEQEFQEADAAGEWQPRYQVRERLGRGGGNAPALPFGAAAGDERERRVVLKAEVNAHALREGGRESGPARNAHALSGAAFSGSQREEKPPTSQPPLVFSRREWGWVAFAPAGFPLARGHGEFLRGETSPMKLSEAAFTRAE